MGFGEMVYWEKRLVFKVKGVYVCNSFSFYSQHSDWGEAPNPDKPEKSKVS